ncbi:SHOCT domain-containing protein [Sulfuriflexus sp.]|uniref:SHOCT domain-containing protein n=1 Tax=Sulfuriflexus sp. TaxID=2015443 RepID=UPI0028CF0125|nr:SHOCT domain-containing protein [Sulfuriflexus sp.]MDT8403194.1 SHOCT domain-containing protein [Sulfuriflexus sp.]
MMDSSGGMFFGGSFMWIFWILLIVILVVVVKAMSNTGGSGSKPTQDESPMEILKKRYARGEIDEEEFDRRRKELES